MTTASASARVGSAPAATSTPPASGPPWRRWANPRNPILAATAVAFVLHMVWALFLATEGGDLAAQAAWTHFVGNYPWAAYNLSWYGGIHVASYSVISPFLMAWFGIRTVAVISGTLSATLAATMLVRFRAPVALPAAVWAAFAISCNSASGRTTFGLGLLFALAAVMCAFTSRGTPFLRASGMVGFGLLATFASPVAGLFLLVVGAAMFLTGRRRAGVAICLGMPLVVGTTTLLFPFTGVQPISLAAIVLPAIASVVAVLVCAPKDWRLIRVGAGVYLAGILLTWLIPSPVGSNVERMSLVFGGVFLLCAVGRVTDWRRIVVLSLAFIVTGVWQVVKPMDDLIHTTPAAEAAARSRDLIAQLRERGADKGRVEVVPLRSHWEAAGLSRQVILARGWNRQVDAERNALFYQKTLTAADYRDWLRKWAVHYVVLPEQEIDWSSHNEDVLVRTGQPYLTEVWSDANWRLFKVADPAPLVAAPATVHRFRPDKVVVNAPAAGTYLVRVAYSPWLSVHGPGKGACLADTTSGPNKDFVQMKVPGPGRYTVGARYELPRGTPCE
ncbi:MFS transporter [Spirillospora sp. NPDC049652]